MRLRILYQTIFLITSFKAFSQSFLGISASNYGGSNMVFLNPANVVDTRTKISINLMGLGAELQNDFGRWGAPYHLAQLLTRTVPQQYRSATSDKAIWRPDYFIIPENKGMNAFINAEARGPAVQINFPDKRIGIAAGFRIRLFSSLSNKTSNEIGEMLFRSTRYVAASSPVYQDAHLNFNIGLYNEYFGTIGTEIINDDSRYLKIGITGKRFTSNMQMSLIGDNLDFVVSPDPLRPTRQVITLTESKGSFSNADFIFEPSIPWLINQWNNVKGIGNGFGLDLGVVYEFRESNAKTRYRYKGKVMPDPQVNKYILKLGIAANDIGFVKFNATQGTVNDVFNTIQPGDFGRIQSPTDLINRVGNLYNLNPVGLPSSYTVLMPANITSYVDYKVKEGFYFTAIYRQRLLNQKRVGPLNYSGINLIPRFEKKHFEYSFLVSLENDFKNFNVGATMRAGPLYLGLDNLTGFFKYGNPRGLSLYGGLMVPIYYSMLKSNLKCYFEEKPYKPRKKGFFKRR